MQKSLLANIQRPSSTTMNVGQCTEVGEVYRYIYEFEDVIPILVPKKGPFKVYQL